MPPASVSTFRLRRPVHDSFTRVYETTVVVVGDVKKVRCYLLSFENERYLR